MAKKTLKARDIEALENTAPSIPPTLDIFKCTTFTGMCQFP